MAILTILAAAVAGAAILATADTEDTENSVQVEKLGDSINDNSFAVINFGKTGMAGIQVPKKPERNTGYVPKTQLAQVPFQTVSIPQNFAGLEAVDIPTRLADQFFEIVDVDEEQETVTITARHVWYQNLRNNTLWKPEKDHTYSCAEVCRNILGNAVFDSDFECATDCTDTLPDSELDFERKNIVEAFLDPEKGVCKKFGLSLIRDNWRFYALKNVGYDRGFIVERGKNMLGVERTENIENLSTRVAPIAKDSNGNIVWMNNNGLKYIDSQYINNYRDPYLEIFDTGLQIGKNGVTSDNVQAKLLEAAQKRFSEDKVDLPEVTMTIEFISLGDTEEYKQYRDLDKVYLYDILTVKDEEKGYNYSAQVIGVEHDILTGRLNSVTIGMLKQADASRKIAVWQVPEIDGTNIRLLSIQAGAFAPGAIQHDDIAPRIITADLIKSGEIQTEHLQAGSVTTEKLEAEAVTAGKIQAGAVTTEKLDAYAVTSAKIAAGAVTTDKLDADVITADKISATDLAAINAKLGTASIAQAEIEVADINFAHIKDLNAQSAYFGQTIFDEGIGGKLYVPRLNVGYAQMVGATIGDLVIQASNGNFYGIDVDMNGNVTATQRTVSAGEIAAGHTSDGRTLVLDTDILATDLTTENIYASHALMNEITAATISVDELWARTAFIGKLMTTDISSNTYIQATIGNWQSGSTITQSINSLNSRISELGFGTVYFQPTEPDHAHLTEGDIWVKSSTMADWKDVYDSFDDWEEVYNAFDDWQTLCAVDRMFVWTGVNWKEMYDADLPTTLQTEIEQLANAITLKASMADVNLLADEVTEFSAQLTIQAQEIQSAVSAVNLKAASYVMQADPRTAYTVSVGDIWIKWDGTTDWETVYDKYADWEEVYNTFDDWSELTGSKTYVWNGIVWVETSDRAGEIYQQTLIDQTINQVEILAEAAAQLGDELIHTQASITVTNSAIEQEVSRAMTAENAKLDKTSTYQTADSIVNAAKSYVNGILQSEAQIQTIATGITAYVTNHAYGLVSGVEILAAGVEISGGKYIKVKTGGSFIVQSGNFSISEAGAVVVKGTVTAGAGSVIGGWVLAANNLHSGSGGSYVALASSGTYAFWAGAENAASAPSRIKFNGEATFTKLMILNEQGAETEVNLRTYGLWKLNYHTVKAYSTDSITLSNGAVVNFIKASSLGVGSGAGRVFVLNAGTEMSGTSRPVVVGIDTEVAKTYSGGYVRFNAKAYFSAAGGATIVSSQCLIEDKAGSGLAYDAGYTYGKNDGYDIARGYVTMPSAGTGTSFTVGVPNAARTGADTRTFTITKGTPSADGGYAAVHYNNTSVARISLDDWWDGGYEAGEADGIAEYYNSSYWEKATADNNWTPKIPNSTNTGSEDWADSGASDAYAAGSPASGTASGRSGSSYSWTFRILKADGAGTNLTIDCSAIYSDARQGYTQGIFSQYSGAQLYTMGQSGPERYTGTLYVKS